MDPLDAAESGHLLTPEANKRLLAAQREIISRQQVKPHAKRTDRHGLAYITGHLGLLGGTGYLIFLAMGTYWLVPAMFVHGVILTHLFAPLHETCHRTAFRSLWLNEAVLWFCGIAVFWPPNYFRYEHAGHHTYAQESGKDPEMLLPQPATYVDYVYYLLGVHLWIKNIGWILRHASGRMAPFDRRYVPDEMLPQIYREARVMLAVYGLAIIGGVAAGSWAPAFYFFIPAVIGLPVQRLIRIGDHVGCAYGLDMRRYARTIKTGPLTRFLCWNMPYHCEHHVAPAVPFHALPALYAEIGHTMNPSGRGYLATQIEVIRHHLTPGFRLHLGDRFPSTPNR